MEDFTVKLQKLEDKMLYEFDELKNFYSVMYKNYPKNLDNLLFKVKYQVDQTKNDIFTRQEKEVIGERYYLIYLKVLYNAVLYFSGKINVKIRMQ